MSYIHSIWTPNDAPADITTFDFSKSPMPLLELTSDDDSYIFSSFHTARSTALTSPLQSIQSDTGDEPDQMSSPPNPFILPTTSEYAITKHQHANVIPQACHQPSSRIDKIAEYTNEDASRSREATLLEYNEAQLRTLLSSESVTNQCSPAFTANCLHFMSHLLELMPVDLFEKFLLRLSYYSTPSPTIQAPEQRVWRSKTHCLPSFTLPSPRHQTDWSKSPIHPIPDNPSELNVATMSWTRSESFTVHKIGSVFVAADSPLPESPAVDIRDIDLTSCVLYHNIQVNCSFERLFGYTQEEIRQLFMMHGKRCFQTLVDNDKLRKLKWKRFRGETDGQNEFSYQIDINTKYGQTPLPTLMIVKEFTDQHNIVVRKCHKWIALPRD